MNTNNILPETQDKDNIERTIEAQLSSEMQEYFQLMQLSKSECISRFILVERIRNCIEYVEQQSDMPYQQGLVLFIYGSFSSFLSLP